jgi:hypothetical protein
LDDSQSQRELVATIEAGVRQVRDLDMRPGQLLKCEAFPPLRAVEARANGSTDPYDRAFALEQVLRAALDAMGDGPYGEAARLLLGAVPGTRGRAPRYRRQLAADELGLMVETFRKNYEDDMLFDVAMEVLRIERAARQAEGSSGVGAIEPTE